MKALVLWLRTLDSIRSWAIAHEMIAKTELPKDIEGMIDKGTERNFGLRTFEQMIGRNLLLLSGQLAWEDVAWSEDDIPEVT